MTDMALNVRELTVEEIDWVGGGDRGDATVAGVFAGGAAGWNIVRGASWGARLGAFAGPAGFVFGGILGGGLAYAVHMIASAD
jgi:hypothetical protein